MIKSRGFPLAAVGLLHAALILFSYLSSRGLFIKEQTQAPAIIGFLAAAFLLYGGFCIGTILLTKGFHAGIRSLIGLPLFAGSFFVAFLVLALIFLGLIVKGTGSQFIPFLSESPQRDEITVWVFSWIIFSGVVSAPVGSITFPETRAAALENRGATAYFKSESFGEEREFTITQLASRAIELQRRSMFILLGIIAMLIMAALFIVFAGQITSLDVSGVKLVSLAQSDVRAAEDELERISSEIARKLDARRRAKEQAAKGGDARASDVALVDDVTAGSDDEINRLKYDAKKAALAKANEVLLKVKEKQFEDEKTRDQASGQNLLIQTSVTRFGVVLIMIFLVQILVNLYRYNMRLSAFYFSRADALILVRKDPVNLRELVELIAPDKLDFGKSPRTPAEEAAGVLAAWSGRAIERAAKGAHQKEPKSGKSK